MKKFIFFSRAIFCAALLTLAACAGVKDEETKTDAGLYNSEVKLTAKELSAYPVCSRPLQKYLKDIFNTENALARAQKNKNALGIATLNLQLEKSCHDIQSKFDERDFHCRVEHGEEKYLIIHSEFEHYCEKIAKTNKEIKNKRSKK